MFVISIANNKGGVAKTTVAYLLSQYLCQSSRVLAVDLDARSDLSALFGVDRGQTIGVGQLLIGENSFEDVTFPVEVESGGDRLFCIPASYDLPSIERKILAETNPMLPNEKRLPAALSPAATGEEPYDFLIFDCKPDIDLFTTSALYLSDMVIVPVPCAYLDFRGFMSLMVTLKDRIRSDDYQSVIRILPTKFVRRERNSIEGLAVLQEYAANNGLQLLPPVPRSVIFENAILGRSPLDSVDGVKPSHTYPFRTLLKELIDAE